MMKKIFIILFLFPFRVFGEDVCVCTHVVDGDTIIVNMRGKVQIVHLIGVDTPETKSPKKPVQYFGWKATFFTKRMVEGKKIILEYDDLRRDSQGRLLAYIYLEDGTFLNAEIIKRGYGYANTEQSFKYVEEFRQYQRAAREQEKGLWQR